MTIKKVALFSVLFAGVCNTQAAETNSDTMIVTANLFPQPVSSVLAPVNIITRDDIEKWQAKSLIDVIKRLPGVDISYNGGRGQSSALYLRGTNERQTLILINGIRVPISSVTGAGNLDQIPINIIDHIEYIRGPRSAVYGSEAIGGVINIITHSDEEKSSADVGVGSNNYQYYNANMHKNVTEQTTVTLSGSFEKTDGFNAIPSTTISKDKDDDGFRSRAIYGEIEHQFSDSLKGFIRGFGYGNYVDYDTGVPPYGNDSFDNQRNLYSRNFDSGIYFNQDALSSQLILSYQNVDDDNFGGMFPTSVAIKQRSVQWGNSFTIGKGSINAGVDWRQEHLDADSMSLKQGRDNTGLYLTANQRISDITLEGAIRTDDNQQFGRHNTWQSAIGWNFFDDYQINVLYGTAFRSPLLNQLYGSYFTNPNLMPEKSKQWEVGLEKQGIINWRISTYRNSISDGIEYDYDYINPGNPKGKYFNMNKILIKGVEFELNFDTGPLNHGFDIEYLKAKDLATNKDLLRRARQKIKYQLGWSIADFDFDIAYQFNGKRYDIGYVRLPSYSTIDLSTAYHFNDNFIIRGKISNIFDKDYETAKGYATAGREFYLTGSYQF